MTERPKLSDPSEMEARIGRRLRKECEAVFGTSWNNDVAWRFARAAMEEMREPTHEMSMIDAPDMPAGGDVVGIWRDMINVALQGNSVAEPT